ncbi:hypothetical protein ACOSP7_027634 [Xanthoceras sorbifolium]
MVSEQEEATASAMDHRNQVTSQLTMSKSSKSVISMRLVLTVKLDNFNFLLWRQQVLAAIKGNRLSSFIDPAVQPPDRFNIDGSVNEEFLDWEQQDQILLVWMLSSITQELLPEFVGCLTTCEAWKSIEQLFSSQSKANIMQLKLQLQTLKKAGLSMTEYLKKKKSIMDALAFAGHPLTNDDKLMQILGGLGLDYHSFIIPITSVQHNYTLSDISSLLLTHEARLDQDLASENLTVNMAANKKGNGGNQGVFNKGNPQGSGQTYNPIGRPPNQAPNHNSNGGRKGRGRGRNFGSDRIFMGNGKGLPISSIGHNTFKYSSHSTNHKEPT